LYSFHYFFIPRFPSSIRSAHHSLVAPNASLLRRGTGIAERPSAGYSGSGKDSANSDLERCVIRLPSWFELACRRHILRVRDLAGSQYQQKNCRRDLLAELKSIGHGIQPTRVRVAQHRLYWRGYR
jgi:hypothetical protein